MSIQSENKNFSAVLTPHRSLSHRGFTILMTLIAVISFCFGAVFLSIGAWPIFGFFGLDVLAIYIAFKWNFRDARLVEYIEMDSEALRIRCVGPSGCVMKWKFNPYWVRIKTEYDESGCTKLVLASHGKTLVVGAFLERAARARFAAAFQSALALHQA